MASAGGCGDINDYLKSKARVPGQTALASLRECVADKKVGGRAKQALKDLTMHSPGIGAARTMMEIISILLAEGKLASDERKALRLATYFLTRISETCGLPNDTELLSMLQTCATSSKDAAMRIACIRALGSVRVGTDESGARAMAAVSSSIEALHKRYASDTDKKARRSILAAFGKRSKDEKDEQMRNVLCRALYGAALAKLKQGVVSLDNHLLEAHRLPMLDPPTIRHALSIAFISLPIRAQLALATLSAFLRHEAHRVSALEDPVAGACLVRMCRAALCGAGGEIGGELRSLCLDLMIGEATRGGSLPRVFLEAISGLSCEKVMSLLQPNQRAMIFGGGGGGGRGPLHRLAACVSGGDGGCKVLQHCGLRCSISVAAALSASSSVPPAYLSGLARSASLLLSSPSLSVQAHSLLLLAWLAPPHNLFNLLGPAMSRDGRGEGSRRKTLPPQMISKVIDALLQRTLREPEIAQIVLAACSVWVRENATEGGGGLDVDALGRVWCTCATVGDADVKTAVVDSIIGVLDMPSLDRVLDCPARTAVWAIGETNQLLLPQSAGPKVGGIDGVLRRLRHFASFANMSARHVAIHAMGRIALQQSDPIRVTLYEDIAALANNEGLGLMSHASPYLIALDKLYLEGGEREDPQTPKY